MQTDQWHFLGSQQKTVSKKWDLEQFCRPNQTVSIFTATFSDLLNGGRFQNNKTKMHTDLRYWMRNISGSLDFSFVLPRHAHWHQILNEKCQWQPSFQLCFTKTCTLTSDTEWETSVVALILALFYQDMHIDIRYWMRNVSGSLHFSFVLPRHAHWHQILNEKHQW